MHFPLAVPVRYSTTTLENVRQVEVKVDTLGLSVQVHLHTLCINSQCAKWQGELEFPAASTNSSDCSLHARSSFT